MQYQRLTQKPATHIDESPLDAGCCAASLYRAAAAAAAAGPVAAGLPLAVLHRLPCLSPRLNLHDTGCRPVPASLSALASPGRASFSTAPAWPVAAALPPVVT